MEQVAQRERWYHYDKYGLWVSDLGVVQNNRGVVLTPTGVNGDLRVSCCFGGETRTFSVKRLIAEAFIPKPFIGNTGLVYFNNGDNTDCRASNLIWRRREQKDRGAYKEPGVSFNKETTRWKAYAVVNRTVFYIGYYDEKEGAIAARDKAYELIAAGVPMVEIRDRLREVIVSGNRQPKQRAAYPHRDAKPEVVTKLATARVPKPKIAPRKKESWRDWDSTKKMFSSMGD